MEAWDSDLFEVRLAWALAKSKVSQSRLADHCKVSSAAVSKWMHGHTKDLKMDNIFAAAEVCAVNARWLATNKGTPLDGINAAFAGISGGDIQLAKRLSEVDDRGLRSTVSELIAAKEVTQTTSKKTRRRRE